MKRHNIDICGVSETKKKGKENTKYDEYILIYSGNDKNKRAVSGMGLLLHEKFQNNIHDTKYISARIGNNVIPGVKNRFNEETYNESGEQVTQICAINGLRINNTYFPHKPQHKFTFENTRGHKSVIDYIIKNRNIQPKRILDVRVLTTANAGTNHNLVMAKIIFRVDHTKKQKPIKVSKLNIESLTTPSTKQLYQQRLNSKISRIAFWKMTMWKIPGQK